MFEKFFPFAPALYLSQQISANISVYLGRHRDFFCPLSNSWLDYALREPLCAFVSSVFKKWKVEFYAPPAAAEQVSASLFAA